MRTASVFFAALVLCGTSISVLSAADWVGFRGPNASGVSSEKNLPATWSNEKNLLWKTDLPGGGSSSPITVGDKVFVTCYSGYGDDGDDQRKLLRHVVCLDKKSGSILWEKTVKPVLPEERYSGLGIPSHGYSSSTPVSDGERVYVFFGKSGVLAFDMEGKQLWQVSVGTGSGPRRWGSGSSPILHKDLVIVSAAEESESLIALNKKTGKEVWKTPASALQNCWSTPILVETEEGEQELVINAPYEVWGLNPDTGKLKWYAEALSESPANPTLVADKGIVYAIAGRGGKTAAIRTGGKGDVTDTHVLWRVNLGSYVPSPVLYDGHLYWLTSGVAYCLNAKDGKTVFRSRLSGGRDFYASPVVADGKVYAVSRYDGTYVLEAGKKFKQLARNEFEGDKTDFNGSPAVSDGRIYLRSFKFLYCVGEE